MGEPPTGRSGDGVGATGPPVRPRRGGRRHRRAARPRRAAGAGPCDAVVGAAPAAEGQGSSEGGGSPVAAPDSGLHGHGAPAEPAPGEREGAESVHAGGAPVDSPDARGCSGARRGRSAAVSRGVVRRLWRHRSAIVLQGAGLLEPSAAALLAGEAMGPAAVPRTPAPRGEPGPRLEHGHVRAGAVASAPQPGAGARTPRGLGGGARLAAAPSAPPSLTDSTEPPET